MEAGREHESTDRDVEVDFLCFLAKANLAQVSEFLARDPDGIERLKRIRDAYDAFAPALAAWAARQPSLEAGIDPGDSAEGNPLRSESIDGPEIPGYRLIRRIGEGGMGVVYHAEKLSPRRSVALKVIHVGADSAAKERAMREIQAMASIASPGIVTLYTDEEIGADMGYVPAGPARIGGDPLVFYPEPERVVDRQRSFGAVVGTALGSLKEGKGLVLAAIQRR